MRYALLALLLLILFLLFLRFQVHIVYEENTFSAYVKVLFFRYSLYPAKEKQEKKKKAKSKDTSADTTKVSQKKRAFTDVMDLVDTVMTVLRDSKDRFLSALTVTTAKVRIVIGSDNPAKTAIVYGVVCQGVAYLFEFLDSITNLKTVKNAEIYVGYDFSASESQTDIHILLSARTIGILSVALCALTSFFRTKIKKDTKNKLIKDGTKS